MARHTGPQDSKCSSFSQRKDDRFSAREAKDERVPSSIDSEPEVLLPKETHPFRENVVYEEAGFGSDVAFHQAS